MNEETIRRAAEDALSDLQLESEIKAISESGNQGEWCVQFAGSYGQFCDKFQDQFEQENSPELIREKIKRYLLKQVTKIRSSSGKSRRARGTSMADKKRDEEFSLGTPFKMVKDVFDQATQIAGGVVQVASSVAETARDAVTDVTGNMRPTIVEVQSRTRPARKKPASSSAKKKGGGTSKKSAKATTKAAARRSSASKKASKASKKAGRKVKGRKGVKG
jgi:hypothetical protein